MSQSETQRIWGAAWGDGNGASSRTGARFLRMAVLKKRLWLVAGLAWRAGFLLSGEAREHSAGVAPWAVLRPRNCHDASLRRALAGCSPAFSSFLEEGFLCGHLWKEYWLQQSGRKGFEANFDPPSEHELWVWGAALPPQGQGLQEDGASSALFGPVTMPFSLWMNFQRLSLAVGVQSKQQMRASEEPSSGFSEARPDQAIPLWAHLVRKSGPAVPLPGPAVRRPELTEGPDRGRPRAATSPGASCRSLPERRAWDPLQPEFWARCPARVWSIHPESAWPTTSVGFPGSASTGSPVRFDFHQAHLRRTVLRPTNHVLLL